MIPLIVQDFNNDILNHPMRSNRMNVKTSQVIFPHNPNTSQIMEINRPTGDWGRLPSRLYTQAQQFTYIPIRINYRS